MNWVVCSTPRLALRWVAWCFLGTQGRVAHLVSPNAWNLNFALTESCGYSCWLGASFFITQWLIGFALFRLKISSTVRSFFGKDLWHLFSPGLLRREVNLLCRIHRRKFWWQLHEKLEWRAALSFCQECLNSNISVSNSRIAQITYIQWGFYWLLRDGCSNVASLCLFLSDR